ncbi:hypothetical protein ATCC90586_006521 [Pythium insidiosum]|nr:hypothetical protein ATCC90586_006521 [Pythium insidiosum]
MHGVFGAFVTGATLVMAAASAASSVMENAASFGTFVRCESGNARCLWVGQDGALVERDEMMRQLMSSENLDMARDTTERRRLEHHVQYIEDVHRVATESGVAFSYKMGVNTRHLYLDDRRTQTPAEFVNQEAHARRRRRLEEAHERRELEEMNRRLADIPKTLNWCSDDNPKKKNICTPIKSQNKCWQTRSSIANRTEEEKNASCQHNAQQGAASIENWEQAVGRDCSKASKPTELLKIALQRQPISVAINSGNQFKDYKGGIYECPNNGDFADSTKVDHAVVLVGYGVDGADEYWILKNSYSSQWGEKGFFRLRMDTKINCGVNIFPVVPLGAKPGFQDNEKEASMASTRYIDQRAFELYEDDDGQEVIVTRLVPIPPAEAFDAWLEHVWKGPMLQEVRPGQGRGHVGHTRKVPLGVVEEILSAGTPRENGDTDEIPSILYKLREFGPFLLKDHLGFVRFVPDRSEGKPSTLIVWTVKSTPSSMGNVLCCGGSITRLTFRTALTFFLSRLSSQISSLMRTQ